MKKYKIGNPYWQIIGFLFFTIISINAFGQKDTTKHAAIARHIISIHETSDFFLSQYGYDTKPGNYPHKYAYYSHYPFGGLRDFYDFSIGIKYEYKISRSIGVSSGLFLSRYAFSKAYTNPIHYMDTLQYWFDYYVTFFYLPIGFNATFFNRGFIRPRLGFDLINAFLVDEKAGDWFYKQQLFSMKSDTLRYYFLKPQITLGCDFYIKKKYRIGIEMVWKGNSFYHTNKTMPYRFKYTNLCFGVNFGYVIK